MKRSRELEEEEEEGDFSEDAIGSSDEQQRLGDAATRPATKIAELDESAVETGAAADVAAMRCSLPPHPETLTFSTYADYESHYAQTHTNRCAQCHKNFPSEHFLNIHFEDCHDAFVAVKRDRGERTYSCFVEGCARKCRTPFKRRNHLIDKHMFPKNYFFALTRDGIDGRHSLLLDGGHRNRRRSSTATVTNSPAKASERKQSHNSAETSKPLAEDEQMDTKEPVTIDEPSEKPSPGGAPDVDMDCITNAMSALQFVPASVRFGRSKGKTGFAKR